jgi:diaminohydroxyphosphoribosylaminopyrimidine deaminase/5-amino-6-(5-phosphoribosylamino)uracil reductase
MAVIASGVRRVVIGTIDPNPRVDGGGIAAMKAAGIEVVHGVLESACRRLNAPFFKYITTALPWVAVKYAMSIDGKIATVTGDSAWISSEASRARVHHLRDQYDAVLVGTQTLRRDDPRLTCRREGGRDPWRVIVDARLEAPDTSRVFDAGRNDSRTLVIAARDAPEDRRFAIEATGAEVVLLETDEQGWIEPRDILGALAAREILSVLVEGGGALIGSLLDASLVDELYAFICPRLIGGQAAPGPVAGRGIASMKDVLSLEQVEIEQIGPDVLVKGMIPH